MMWRSLKSLFVLACACATVGHAQAHALLLPLNHRAIFGKPGVNSKLLSSLTTKHNGIAFNSLFSNGLVGSTSTRAFLLEQKNIVSSSFLAGSNSVSASALISAIPTGGQIEGDLYVPGGGPNQYSNVGEYVFSNVNFPFSSGLTFQSPGGSAFTPGFINSLSLSNTVFGAQTSTKLLSTTSVHGIVIRGLTGSAARLQKELDGLSAKSFRLGATANSFSGGSLTGGEFYGQFWGGVGSAIPALKFEQTFTGPVLFAFGNNPLNNPAAVGAVVNISTATNYFEFGSVMRSISSGQIRGTLIIGTDPANPAVGPFPAFFALGSSPLNTANTLGIISNPAQFFTFF
jgi:hypothetical protein